MRIFTWLCRKEISCLFEQNGQLTRNLKRAEDARHKAECELGQVKKKLYELQLSYDQLKIDFDKRSQDYREAELLIERQNLDLTEKSETIERLQHTIDESIARRDEIERGAERLKAGNEDAEHCAELFKVAVANGTKFAEESYNRPNQKKTRYCGRISEDTYNLIKKFCDKHGVSFRWIIELSCSICVPLFDASIEAVQNEEKNAKKTGKEQPKTKIPPAKEVKISRSKLRAEMDCNEPRTKRVNLLFRPSLHYSISRMAAEQKESVNHMIEKLLSDYLAKNEVK